MKRKVIIKSVPQAQSGLEVKMNNLRAGLGFNANKMPWPVMAGKMSAPDVEVNSTLQPVPRDQANLEAEKGEVASLPTKGGVPDTFKIGGKRHHSGGTPLNLPSDSFIYSDTAKMKIKDPAVLAQFGLSERKGGYTPAEIAKKYDVNSFKKILMDPDTDKLQKQTAELMISNYNLKLAKLAIVQESMKGFPQGIPAVAMPYIEEMEIDPAQFVQMNPGGAQDEQAQTQQGEMDDVGAEAQGRFGGFMQDGGNNDYYSHNGPWRFQLLPGLGNRRQGDNAFNPMMFDSPSFITANTNAVKMYEKALRSNNPQVIEQAAQELEKTDIPYSVGWLPWTQQDKLEDLAAILRERKATLMSKPESKPQYSKFQASDEAASKKADQLYTAVLKKYNALQETNPDSPEAYAAKKQLDYMFKLTRDYKNLPSTWSKNQWYKSSNTPVQSGLAGASYVQPEADMQMYSPEEIAQINKYHNMYVPQTAQTTKKTKQELDADAKFAKEKEAAEAKLLGQTKSVPATTKTKPTTQSSGADYEQIFNY